VTSIAKEIGAFATRWWIVSLPTARFLSATITEPVIASAWHKSGTRCCSVFAGLCVAGGAGIFLAGGQAFLDSFCRFRFHYRPGLGGVGNNPWAAPVLDVG
jgi:hypothetical protein